MIVELIGGPLDGDRIELNDAQRYYRIPMFEPPALRFDDDSVERVVAALDAFRCGIYSQGDNPREFHWRGQE